MIKRIDPKVDSAFYIFDYLFECRIPNLESTSVDYIRHFGTPTTGDQRIDNELANELITTFLPIATMVEHYKNGVRVYIPRYEDLTFMYDCVSNHLNAWKTRMEHAINIGEAPIEDLIDLDQFANALYDKAKYQLTPDIIDSLFMRHISSNTRLNKGGLFKDSPKPLDTTKQAPDGTVQLNSEKDSRYPERTSLTDLFKDRIVGTKSWR